MAGNKVIFLDRDGTLIVDHHYLNDPDRIDYLPGVFEALSRLRSHGYKFVIVTNQSGVARGVISRENLEEIHRRIKSEFSKHGIEFAKIYDAPYTPESIHPDRKPNPGMLMQAKEEFGIDLEQSWMIGDRMSDVEAGTRAGCKTVLLKGIETPTSVPDWKAPDLFVSGLLEAAEKIISSN